MADTIKASGGCLCGAVSVTASAMATNIGACHCSICRKWGGGPLLAVDCHEDVQFSGEAHISLYQSSSWAERAFCNRCGTHLYYKLLQPLKYIMPAGLFDSDAPRHFDHQVFIDEKPDYYAFAGETHNMTGAEVFAAFGADES